MTLISLSPFDLALAAFIILSYAGLTFVLRLQLGGQIMVSAARAFIQLLLIGFVLKTLFEHDRLIWVVLMAFVMLITASREAVRRQTRKFHGLWGLLFGSSAMFLVSFTITLIALTVIISHDPWYEPRYAIPVLGMMLGNTMNGISLGLERLTTTAWQQRDIIENRLMLAQTWNQAIEDVRREAIHSGLIPIVNAMAVAGIVSLPGMMTGQILAGNAPMEAVKYQILIFFLIAASVGFGTIAAVWLASRYLFDHRQRLRLDRLEQPVSGKRVNY